MAKRPICKIEGCGKPHYGRGWCNMHYQRDKKGTPMDAPIATKPGSLMEWVEANKDHDGDECLSWPFSASATGRGVIKIDGRQISSARAMCIAAHGNPPTPQHEAAHNCGKGHEGCVNPKHLRWATTAENCADKENHGTYQRGEKVGTSKLTDDDVMQIKSLIGQYTQAQIAKQFGVSQSLISLVKRGKSWNHV